MNTLIIFCAKYLLVISPLTLLWLFYKCEPAQRKDLALRTFSILGLSYILGLIARTLYYDPRPFVVEGFQPLLQHIADNGFPSDHTLLLAAIAASAGLFDRRVAVLLWLVTLVVGISRILAGVHHSIDIIGSIVIALLAKWIVYFVFHRLKKL